MATSAWAVDLRVQTEGEGFTLTTLLNLAGHVMKYGRPNWPIIAHILTKGCMCNNLFSCCATDIFFKKINDESPNYELIQL